MQAQTIESQRQDITVGQFTAPYDESKKGWRFPSGERIGNFQKALNRAKQFAEYMGKLK